MVRRARPRVLFYRTEVRGSCARVFHPCGTSSSNNTNYHFGSRIFPQLPEMNAVGNISPTPAPLASFLDVSERERRFAIAYVEASIELCRDDRDANVLAYFRAFPSARVDSDQAAKLAKFLTRRPAVKELVQHLRRELSARAMVPASRVIQELERLAYVNPADYSRVDERGQLQVDLSRVGYDQLAGIVEFETKEQIVKTKVLHGPNQEEITETYLKRSTKVKFAKMDAIKELAKIHALYDEGVTDDDVRAAIQRAVVRFRQKISPVMVTQVPEAKAS